MYLTKDDDGIMATWKRKPIKRNRTGECHTDKFDNVWMGIEHPVLEQIIGGIKIKEGEIHKLIIFSESLKG